MPDYSVIQKLCEALSNTLSELMDGEDAAEDSVRVYDDAQIRDLLRRTQELERQKGILYGLIPIVLGIACNAMSKTTGGTEVQDFSWDCPSQKYWWESTSLVNRRFTSNN